MPNEIAEVNSHQETQPTAQLSPKQVAALEFLLLGQTVAEAVKSFGVDRRTLHRWIGH